MQPRKWGEGGWRCSLGQISHGPLCSGQEFRLDLEDTIGWEGLGERTEVGGETAQSLLAVNGRRRAQMVREYLHRLRDQDLSGGGMH